jgi:hypothetical protein
MYGPAFTDGCEWIAATDADVARDGTIGRYRALLASPVGRVRREFHNGRLWKLRVVSSATDPGLTTFAKDVRGWICRPRARRFILPWAVIRWLLRSIGLPLSLRAADRLRRGGVVTLPGSPVPYQRALAAMQPSAARRMRWSDPCRICRLQDGLCWVVSPPIFPDFCMCFRAVEGNPLLPDVFSLHICATLPEPIA